MKQIIIEIGPDGSVKIEAIGFKGSACEAATKPFEQALGVAQKKTKKPEYSQAAQNTQNVG